MGGSEGVGALCMQIYCFVCIVSMCGITALAELHCYALCVCVHLRSTHLIVPQMSHTSPNSHCILTPMAGKCTLNS